MGGKSIYLCSVVQFQILLGSLSLLQLQFPVQQMILVGNGLIGHTKRAFNLSDTWLAKITLSPLCSQTLCHMIRSALPLIMRNVWRIFTTQFLSKLLLHTRLNVMSTTIQRQIFMVHNFHGLIVEVKIMYHENAVLMSQTCMNNQ